MANMKQIAKKCGVSVATVSRVVNHPESVSAETLEKIVSVMNELNYAPNEQARSLTLNRTNTIALIIPNILNPLYTQIATGIEKVVHQKGSSLLLCNTEQNVHKESEYLNMLIKRKVDGLILSSTLLSSTELIRIKNRGIPLVVIGQNTDDISTNMVIADLKLGAYQAINHLIEIGHKDIAFINGTSNHIESNEKYKGFERAMVESNLSINKDFVVEAESEVEGGYFSAKKLLQLNVKPTAIFACNDLMAIGAMDAIKSEGLLIPKDIAIVGFDDTMIASLVEPKLTTVSHPAHKMGLIGARLLFDAIENKEEDFYQKILLEPVLKVRKSCGHEDRVREIFS